MKSKVDDLAIDITLNSKIKVYFRNKWNTDPVLVYYGYITSIDPFIQAGEERTALTCLGAISKLQNDFLQHRTQLYKGQLAYLAYEVENKEIDEHIKEILVNYWEKINDTYSDYDPCMIDDPTTYWADTDYIKDSSGVGTFRYRYFTMKHLDAIKEITTFLPKTLGNYYYYYLAEDDVSVSNPDGKSRFILKTLSATADYTLQINKHITSLSMRRNIEGTVNTVYFWNELGVTGEKVLMTAEDSAFQQKYDVIADRITDAKVTTRTQANLLAQAKLEESKDVKAEVTVTVSDANFDILNLRLGQVINIRDTKRAGRTDDTYNLFPDDTLVIQKIILTPREAVLELTRPRPDLSTQVETDREYIDKQLVNFGNILTKIDASRLDPGGLHWITDDIVFSAVDDTKIQWIGGDETAVGTFKLPSGVQRVIAGGDTGVMTVGKDYYLYVDEKNVWCTKDTGLVAKDGGTGSVKVGENTLIDAGKSWRKDQWKGYALWINPTGGSEEKHIIAQNYETHLIVEGHDPFNTTDATCPYEIHPLVLRQTTLRGKKVNAGGYPLRADVRAPQTKGILKDSDLNETDDDFWKGFELMILSGKNIGIKRIITGFSEANNELSFDDLPFVMATNVYYELYLNPETQFGIITGVPTSEVTQEAEILPETPAVENSAYFNAVNHIVANSITTNEVNFTVPGIGNIIATINASTEDGGTLKIDANHIRISGAVTFSANWEAAANVGALAAKDAADYATQVSGVKPPSNADHTADIVSAMAYYSLVEDAMKDETIIVGGWIDANFLTADNIVAGTLTGRKVRTSSGITRIELNAADNALYGYYLGTKRLELNQNYITWYSVTGNLAGSLAGVDNGLLNIYAGTDAVWQFERTGTDTGNFSPAGSGKSLDLGTSSYCWRDLYLSRKAYVASGDIIFQVHTIDDGDKIRWAKHMYPWVNPSGSLGYDLGSSSYNWRNLYCNNLYHGSTKIANLTANYLFVETELLTVDPVQVDQGEWEATSFSLLVSNNSAGANAGKGYADYWATYSEYTEIEKIASKYLQLSEEEAKTLILENVVKEAKTKIEATKKDKGRFVYSTKKERIAKLEKYEKRILNKEWTNKVNLAYEQKRFSTLEQGTVMAFSDNGAIPTNGKGQTNIMGVISTSPCFTAYAEDDGIQITKFGHTFAKVKGKCKAGDILWTSNEEGCLEKAINPSAGQIVARARGSKKLSKVKVLPVDLTL